MKKLIKLGLYILMVVSIIQLFTIKEVVETPAGNYISRGGIIKICSGSEEVYDYLGI